MGQTTIGTKDLEFAEKLRADEVIDYKNQDFADMLSQFDAVFDTVGGDVTTRSFEVLKRSGILVSIKGQPDPNLSQKYGVVTVGQFTKTNVEHLRRLAELVDGGSIRVHVDKIFPLQRIKDAFEYQENVHHRGKVVVQIAR